jgi:hypothetical protein
MKKIYRLLLTAGVFSFVFGWLWSTQIAPNTSSSQPASLTLLAPHWFIDANLKTHLERTGLVQLELLGYRSWRDLRKQLNDNRVHAALVPAAITHLLIHNQTAKPFPEMAIEYKNKIHVDFLGLAFDPRNVYSLPLFWKVDDPAVRPQEGLDEEINQVLNRKTSGQNGARLWLLNVISLAAPNQVQIQSLLNAFMSDSIALNFTTTQPMGVTFSTNAKIEISKSPQHLRKLPISRVRWAQISEEDLAELFKK